MPAPANRKFIEWLQEWKDSLQPGNNQQYSLAKAINGLRSASRALSPYELQKEVKGIGASMQAFIIRKTDIYLNDGGQVKDLYNSDVIPAYVQNQEVPVVKKRKLPVDETLEALSTRPIVIQANKKQYRPKFRSGGYGLLMALHEHGTLPKSDLLKVAQPYCDASYTSAEVGHYSAWNSMSTLIKKDLIVKTGNPSKFTLTLDGSNVAEELWNQTRDFESSHSGAGSIVATVVSSQEPIRLPRVSILPFQYWYLSQDGRRVFEQGQAHKKVHHGDKAFYKIQYHKNQSHHAFAASHVKKESMLPDQNGLLVGYIQQSVALEECPGISSHMEAEIPKPVVKLATKPVQKPASKPTQKPVQKSAATTTSQSRPPTQPTVQIRDIPLSERDLWPTEPEYKEQLKIPWTGPPVRFGQGQFDVVMLLDNREIRAHADREYFADKMKEKGVKVEVRMLELGDIMWIARNRLTSQEIVLDMVVERKRLDDLVSSIKDGRFKEQKSRLRKCSLTKMWYLVEDHSCNATVDFNKLAIRAAMTETFLLDQIQCKRTSNIDDTIEFLKLLHQYTVGLYSSQDLYAIPAGLVQSSDFVQFKQQCDRRDHRTYHYMYAEFAELNSKSKTSTLKDVWFKQLMAVRGLSVEKANVIVQQYQTMHMFMQFIHSLGSDKQERSRSLRLHFASDPRKSLTQAVCTKLVNLFSN